MAAVSKILFALAILIILLTTVTLIESKDLSESMGKNIGPKQMEFPAIEDSLMFELSETSLDSGVNVIGVSYYEDIDAIVIGLEKKTYSDN